MTRKPSSNYVQSSFFSQPVAIIENVDSKIEEKARLQAKAVAILGADRVVGYGKMTLGELQAAYRSADGNERTGIEYLISYALLSVA